MLKRILTWLILCVWLAPHAHGWVQITTDSGLPAYWPENEVSFQVSDDLPEGWDEERKPILEKDQWAQCNSSCPVLPRNSLTNLQDYAASVSLRPLIHCQSKCFGGIPSRPSDPYELAPRTELICLCALDAHPQVVPS